MNSPPERDKIDHRQGSIDHMKLPSRFLGIHRGNYSNEQKRKERNVDIFKE